MQGARSARHAWWPVHCRFTGDEILGRTKLLPARNPTALALIDPVFLKRKYYLFYEVKIGRKDSIISLVSVQGFYTNLPRKNQLGKKKC